MLLLRRPTPLVGVTALTLLGLAGCAATSAGSGGAGGSGDASTSITTGASTSASGPSAATGASVGTGQGGGASCASLPAGPLTPAPLLMGLDGAEDLAFDGHGHIAAKKAGEIVLVDAQGAATHLASLPEGVFGLRYEASGDLVAAVFGQGKLVRISPSGQVSDRVTGLGLPNGVYPDSQGHVWVTETSADRVTRVDADATTTTIVPYAPSANGVVLDETRDVLFYTDSGAGKLMRVAPSGGAPPVEVATIAGATLDGLVLDACGNVYAIDQGGSALYRVALDPQGDAIGEAKLLATFPKNVANAQFGAGPGFSPTALYVTGTPGTVYELDVGVAGAPVVMPP